MPVKQIPVAAINNPNQRYEYASATKGNNAKQ